jgi:serine/threonine protein kinase
MEYLGGGDLFTYLEDNNFKVEEKYASKIIHSLGTALYYIHSYGITHRDLKPENILLENETPNSDVKIVDFGLSQINGPGEMSTEPFGSLCYVAPEVLLGRPYDKSVDIWSLGLIFTYNLFNRMHYSFTSCWLSSF